MPALSAEALRLLRALAELEDAGLIENGRSELMVQDGYDRGSLEAQAAPTITPKGRKFLAAQSDSAP